MYILFKKIVFILNLCITQLIKLIVNWSPTHIKKQFIQIQSNSIFNLMYSTTTQFNIIILNSN